MNTQKTYSISVVSHMTGVSKNRIREWQGKGLLPEAHTISVGSRQHRRFTEKDVQIIRDINAYQRQGFILSAAAKRALDDSEEVKRCQ